MLKNTVKLMLVMMFVVAPIFGQAFGEIKAIGCLPPEGDMDAGKKTIFINAVEGAFTSAGYKVADRKRIEKLLAEMKMQQAGGIMEDSAKAAQIGNMMKISHFVEVGVNAWVEEKTSALAGFKGFMQAASSVTAAAQGGAVVNVDAAPEGKDKINNVRLSVKIIDIESGMILATGEAKGKEKDSPLKLAETLIKNMEKAQVKKAKSKGK